MAVVGSLYDKTTQGGTSTVRSGGLQPLIPTDRPTYKRSEFVQKQEPQQTKVSKTSNRPKITFSSKKITSPVSKEYKQQEPTFQKQTFLPQFKKSEPVTHKGSSGFSVKKIGTKFIEGIKQLPGMLQGGAGNIVGTLVKQQKFTNNLVEKSGIDPITLYSAGGTVGLSMLASDVFTRPILQPLEKQGASMREAGYQKQKAQQEKQQPFSERGAQKYLEMAVYNFPQMATSYGITAITALLTKNPYATGAVGLSYSYGLGSNEVYNEARSYGLSDNDSLNLAMLGGSIIGALDFIPIERMVRKTGTAEAIKKTLIQKMASVMVQTATQSGYEAVTEGVQEIVGNAVAQSYNENQGLFEGVKEATIVGAMLGVLGGGVAETSSSLIKQGSTIEEVIEEANKEAEKALNTPKEERTEEQQAIVDYLLTKSLTPEEAIKLVVEGDIKDTKLGKEIVKLTVQARQQNKNIQISQTEEGNNITVDLVDKTFTPTRIEPTQETTEQEATTNEIVHSGKSSLETVKQRGVIGSQNGIFGEGVYFTDPGSQTLQEFGAQEEGTSYSIDKSKLNLITLETNEKMLDFIQKQGFDPEMRNLVKALRKEGTYDGAIITNPDEKVGNTYVISNFSRLNEVIRGTEVAQESTEAREKPTGEVTKAKKETETIKKQPVKEKKQTPREEQDEIERYIDSKNIKFRTADTEKGLVIPKDLGVTSRFLLHPEVATREFGSYSHLFNLSKSNSIPLKAQEREIIQDVLDKYYKNQKRINIGEFSRMVSGQLMPLETIITDTWADYGAKNVGLYNLDPRTYLLNSDYEHGETGHFSSDFSQFVSKEDLKIVEIPVQRQNPTEKYAVVRKDVELTEENIEQNVFQISATRKRAKDWIEEHTQGSGSNVHIQTRKKGLFSHFRTFDTRDKSVSHISEIQSDTFQQGLKLQRSELENKIRSLENRKQDLIFTKGNEKSEEGRADLQVMIDRTEQNIKSVKKELENLNPSRQEELFAGYKGIWHERTVREIITTKAREGYKTLRFPTPRTLAVIEGYVSDADSEYAMPYEIEGDVDYGQDLEAGDVINYGGQEMTVISADAISIRVAPSDKVHTFLMSEWVDDEWNARWEDTVYEFENLDYGEINTPEKAQKVLDAEKAYKQLVEFYNKEKDIRNKKEYVSKNRENNPEGRSESFDNYLEQQQKEIERIESRKKPSKERLSLISKERLKHAKELNYYYGLDYEVEQLLTKMADADPDNTYTSDDFMDEMRDDYVETYDPDFEGIYKEAYTQNEGSDERVYVSEVSSETFEQPDQYEQASSIEDFDINNFDGEQKTVLLFYEKQVNRYLQKLRRGNLELIEDENGYQWLETQVKKEDILPPTAYRIKEDLEKVGLKITEEQEQEILKLNSDMFGDTNVKVTEQILANGKALGAYQDRIIKILNKQANPTDTFYHEAVHKYLDIFTERSEHIEILREAKELYGLDDLAQVEERLAEDFIDYANRRKGVSGKLKIFFDRIINRIRTYLKNQNKIDALYTDILSGKAKKATQKVIKNVKTESGIRKVLKILRNNIDNAIIEAEGIATVAQQKREGINTQNVAKLKLIYANTKLFQEGDIETIRKSKHRDLVNTVIENIQETHEGMTEEEAFDFALTLPTKAEERVDMKKVKELQKKYDKIQSYLEVLKDRQTELKVKASKQLDDEWRSVLAQQERLSRTIEVPRSQIPVGQGTEKASRLEARVKKQLKNVSEDVIEEMGLAKYNQMNKEEQISLATQYVTENPEEALLVLQGEKEAPPGLLVNSIFVAMQNNTQGDVDLARRLASITSTRLGQEISILTEIDPESPVNLMRQIVDIREQTIKKRYKSRSIKQVRNQVVKDIKSNVKKTTVTDWNQFIKSIEC